MLHTLPDQGFIYKSLGSRSVTTVSGYKSKSDYIRFLISGHFPCIVWFSQPLLPGDMYLYRHLRIRPMSKARDLLWTLRGWGANNEVSLASLLISRYSGRSSVFSFEFASWDNESLPGGNKMSTFIHSTSCDIWRQLTMPMMCNASSVAFESRRSTALVSPSCPVLNWEVRRAPIAATAVQQSSLQQVLCNLPPSTRWSQCYVGLCDVNKHSHSTKTHMAY